MNFFKRISGLWFPLGLTGAILTEVGVSFITFAPNFVTHIGQVLVVFSTCLVFVSVDNPLGHSLKSILKFWYRPAWAGQSLPEEKIPTVFGFFCLTIVLLILIACLRWLLLNANSIYWSFYVTSLVSIYCMYLGVWNLLGSLRAISSWREELPLE